MSPAHRPRGGVMGLLLSLLAIGAVLYFLLRGGAGAGSASPGAMINCEKLIADLITKTGGLGEIYAAGYEKLPSSCQKLAPAPQALDPAPQKLPDT